MQNDILSKLSRKTSLVKILFCDKVNIVEKFKRIYNSFQLFVIFYAFKYRIEIRCLQIIAC